ncbi:MAG: STAS domain-containing protein [Chloroflexales bacterium]|nr:STAS domain-containing protein [Chloroflexales bacterium]
MSEQQESRNHSRSVYRLVANSLIWISVGVLILLLITFAMNPSLGAAALIVTEGLLIGASFLTIALLPRRPIWQAALPLIAVTYLAILTFALVIVDLLAAALPILALVVLLAALTGRRDLTGAVAALCAATGAALMLIGRGMVGQLDLGFLLPLLQITAPAIVIGLVWMATDQLMRSREQAVALAEGRAAEAEAARGAAEAARREAEARQEEQARLLELVQTLELPVLAVGRGVLAVPLIGSLDSRRLDAIRAAVLEAIGRERAHTVVFDLTGIAEIDTAIAQGLIQTAKAVKLLGARPLISGVRAPVARALAGLGVGLEGFQPVANLHEAFVDANAA